MELKVLDDQISRLTRCVKLCAENPQFRDLGREIELVVVNQVLPLVGDLILVADGAERLALFKRYGELLALLPVGNEAELLDVFD